MPNIASLFPLPLFTLFLSHRVNISEIEELGYELIRPGQKVIEEEAGRTSNRETIAKYQFSKAMTMTSVDFENVSELEGKSELMTFQDRLQIGNNVCVCVCIIYIDIYIISLIVVNHIL